MYMVVARNSDYLETARCANFRAEVFSFCGYFSGSFAEPVWGYVFVCVYIYTYTTCCIVHTNIHTSMHAYIHTYMVLSFTCRSALRQLTSQA